MEHGVTVGIRAAFSVNTAQVGFIHLQGFLVDTMDVMDRMDEEREDSDGTTMTAVI